MSPEKSSVTVRIAGEEHTIRASAEPEYTKQCAKLVDDRIMDIRSKSGGQGPQGGRVTGDEPRAPHRGGGAGGLTASPPSTA